MRTIRLLFLHATPHDHWMNRLVSYWDRPFCHVELDFEMTTAEFEARKREHSVFEFNRTWTNFQHNVQSQDAPSLSIASSVYSGETVFLKPRTYANPHYTILTFTVTDTQFKRMFDFCMTQVNKHVAFDEVRMYSLYLPRIIRGLIPRRGTFCSEYITMALQAGGMQEVANTDASTTSPSALHRIMSQKRSTHTQCFSTVPHKMNLVVQNGQF